MNFAVGVVLYQYQFTTTIFLILFGAALIALFLLDLFNCPVELTGIVLVLLLVADLPLPLLLLLLSMVNISLSQCS